MFIANPAIADSRYYGHQVTVPRVFAIIRVECIWQPGSGVARFLALGGGENTHVVFWKCRRHEFSRESGGNALLVNFLTRVGCIWQPG